MSQLHIFVERWQPFTRFVSAGRTFRRKPCSVSYCDVCGDRRQARNLEVQAYYDGWRIRCKGGRHPGWS
jgi:hypothetical protein